MARELVLIPRSEYEKSLSYQRIESDDDIMWEKCESLTAKRNTKEDLVDDTDSNNQHQTNTLENKDCVDITKSNNQQQRSQEDQRMHFCL